MSIDRLLGQWLGGRYYVTFPIHRDDSTDLNTSASEFYGFSNPPTSFIAHWNLRFTSAARLTAAFIGVLFARDDGSGNYSLLLYNHAPIPREIPDWYPVPTYIKYSIFTGSEVVETIARNLLHEDRGLIAALLATTSTHADVDARVRDNQQRFRTIFRERNPPPTALPDNPAAVGAAVDQLVSDFVGGRLTCGIPVNAKTILVRRTDDITVSLHPSRSDSTDIDDSLYFNPHYYFRLWQPAIQDYGDFPIEFRRKVLGPPVTSGHVRYVKQTAAPGFTPLDSTLQDAIRNSNPSGRINDTILILDKGTYQPRGNTKFLSIMGLADPDDDVTTHDELEESSLTTILAANYPTLRGATGERGLWLASNPLYQSENGLIYLSNLSISGNRLNCTSEANPPPDPSPNLCARMGGAGILVDGRTWESVPEGEENMRRDDFSQVHIHNCAVCSNQMTDYPAAGLKIEFGGGGILCHFSSPAISNCLIRFNTSYYQGGGIGVILFGWPFIKNNIISNNTATGHPTGDLDGGGADDAGGSGDGGGIGVFQNYPLNRSEVENSMRDSTSVPLSHDRMRDALLPAWNPTHLENAKTKWIYIRNNSIHHNIARMSGGGVYGTCCALLDLYDNRIFENNALQHDGGGIAITFGSRLCINGSERSQNTISNNRANREGGGLFIRSAKVRIENCSIHNNGDVTPFSDLDLKGGGIAVASREEIPVNIPGIGLTPAYDVILHIVFDHIDRVELVANNITIGGNTTTIGGSTAPISSDLFMVRDWSRYDETWRSAGRAACILSPLSMYVRVNSVNPIRGVIDVGAQSVEIDNTSVIVTPNFLSDYTLENTL